MDDLSSVLNTLLRGRRRRGARPVDRGAASRATGAADRAADHRRDRDRAAGFRSGRSGGHSTCSPTSASGWCSCWPATSSTRPCSRERAGRLALIGWVITAALAAGLVGVLAAIGFVHAFVPVALALTTTALGTLLPILRDHDLLAGQFGRYILAAGAVGELLPILGIAIFLGAHSQFVAILSLASVGVLALVLSLAPRLARGRRIERIIKEGEHSTSQTTLRFSIVLLLFLLAVAATVRSRRGARRVPGRHGAAPVGTRRRRTRWRRSSTRSATASSSRSSSWRRG